MRIVLLVTALFCAPFLAAGILAALYFGTPSSTSLRLAPGATSTFHVVRLQPEALEIGLFFRRDFGSHRDELGRNGDQLSFVRGRQRFAFPGEPVRVTMKINGMAMPFIAMPARGADMGHWERELVPALDGNDPNTIRYPLEPKDFPQMHRGFNTISLTIAEVGPPLVGEKVDVYLRAPMTPHRHVMDQPDYGLVEWFAIWPLSIAALLMCVAIVRSANKPSEI